jgi:hypothetical protein
MPSNEQTTMQRLLGFNQQVLDQALAVVGEHLASSATPSTEPTSPPFAGPVGAHVRHVIEHYEALLQGLRTGAVDYDSRPRDTQLETSPHLARRRLLALHQQLVHLTPGLLNQAVQVLGQGGTVGDFSFSVASSLGRELAFLASHAVHHFALLAPHLHRHGVAVPAYFGRAPGTVAHEIATRALAALVETQAETQVATQVATQTCAQPNPPNTGQRNLCLAPLLST